MKKITAHRVENGWGLERIPNHISNILLVNSLYTSRGLGVRNIVTGNMITRSMDLLDVLGPNSGYASLVYKVDKNLIRYLVYR